MKAFMDMPPAFSSRGKRGNYISLDNVDGNLEEDKRAGRRY